MTKADKAELIRLLTWYRDQFTPRARDVCNHTVEQQRAKYPNIRARLDMIERVLPELVSER